MTPEKIASAEQAAAPRNKKKRSPAEWAIVALLLAAIAGGAAVEISARVGFQKTLTKLQIRVPAPGQPVPEPIRVDEVDALVSGWPQKTVGKLAEGTLVQYRWRSLFREWQIELKFAGDGSVVALESNVPELADADGQPKPPRVAQLVYAAGVAEGLAPVFALDLQQYIPWQLQGEQGHLTRELLRQAVLIAARDELGLPTRDKALNEPLPNDTDPVLPVMRLVNWNIENRHVSVTLVAPARQGISQPFPFEFDVPPGPWLEELATVTEALSPTDFTEALKQSGFEGQSREFLAEGAIGDGIAEDLAKFDMLSQYAAVRALHTEIAVLGESSARLAALAQGYANLGALTEFLWSPAYKVFGARAMLYAERLLRKGANRPFALRNRAYVRALTGLHRTALADLEQAASLAPGDAPGWVVPVEAFCRSDSRALQQMLDLGRQSALPAFLNLLLAAASENANIRLEAARQMLEIAPDCMSAYELTLFAPALGVNRQVAFSAPASFAESLRLRLGARDYIPEAARKRMPDRAGEGARGMQSRAELVETLTEAAKVGQDAGEPSLGTLATLIREVGFVHTWRQLDLEHSSLGVDATPTMSSTKPIVAGHCFESFLGINVFDQVVAAKALDKAMAVIEEFPVEPSVAPIVETYLQYMPERKGHPNLQQTCDKFALQSDAIFPDLVRILRIDASAGVKTRLSETLREISPASPAGIAAAIAYDWDRVSSSAADWERTYSDNVDVLRELGERYVALDRFDDAVRCLKRQIGIAPDHSSYAALAKLYSDHGDEQLWVDTLVASLDVPSFGLQSDYNRMQLAYHYMKRNEWDKARPLAERAAETYASWGLECAADFCELTGDWTRSEAFERANSERYDTSACDWYYWCRRTGRGDIAAARALMQPRLTYLRDFPSEIGKGTAAALFMLEGQPELSLKALQEGVTFEHRPYYFLMAALRADEQRQPGLRDELLRQAASASDYRFAEFRHWVRGFVAAPNDPVDRALLDWTIRDSAAAEGLATEKLYFAGAFLAAHGREQDAIHYLQQAATSLRFRQEDAVMAAHALRQRGVAIGKWRAMELDPETTRALKELKSARALSDSRRWQECIEACTALIEQAPGFPDVFEQRSFAYLQMDQFELALADINRALELLPACARFHCQRGLIQDRQGRYQNAIDDYQAALRHVPGHPRAHHELALIYGACPDASIRDARKGQQHAQGAADSGELPQYLTFADLAIAAAEAGDFRKAVQWQAQAISTAPEQMRDRLSERKELFERNKPYHRSPQWWKQQ